MFDIGLLISKEEFNGVFKVDNNLNTAKELDPFIRQAQDQDISLRIGESLLLRLAKFAQGGYPQSPTDEEQVLINCLEGCEYVNDCGNTVYHRGLKVVVCHYTMSRALYNDGLSYSSSGGTKVGYEFAERPEVNELYIAAKRQKQIGANYLDGVIKYFCANADVLPEFKPKDEYQKQNGGTRIYVSKGRRGNAPFGNKQNTGYDPNKY